MEDLTILIRDSEIVNEINWGGRDVMRAFTLPMVLDNPFFQNSHFVQNLPGQQQQVIAESIFNQLDGILVKRNVSNDEYKIQRAVRNMQDDHYHIRTPRIISYVRGPYPIPYPVACHQDRETSTTGSFLTEEKRNNVMIMERVNGRDLASIYGSRDEDTPDEIYERCRAIITTLREERIYYPDITSYNFILDDQNHMWIIDFGHAHMESYFIQDFVDGHAGWNPDMA